MNPCRQVSWKGLSREKEPQTLHMGVNELSGVLDTVETLDSRNWTQVIPPVPCL